VTRGVVAAVAVALGASGAAACSAGGAHGPTEFSSEEYGYTVELPAGWTALAAGDELGAGQPPLVEPAITDVLSARPDRRPGRMQLPALVIGGQRVQRGTSLPAWERIVTGIVRYEKGCDPPAASRPVFVGEEEGALLAYPDCPEGSGLVHTWIAAVHRDRGYHLVWVSRRGQEAADRRLLDRLLRSWQFDV
jgi:hypothetical protein